jgi:ketosteroid isomerase-like protein
MEAGLGTLWSEGSVPREQAMVYRDWAGGLATVAGLDHVRLSYDYLDRGDADGYASLLDARAVLEEPGRDPVRGRGAVAGLPRLRGYGEHRVQDVFAADGRVAALGSFRNVDGTEVDFADVFTVSEHGLLVRQRCFHFVNPG